jgi:glycosyltransferase involved in cell wall biosynthesis
MKFTEFLSVVIPAYNEEEAVEKIIERTRKVLSREKIKHEIIVVDDGSQDATAQRAQKAKAHVVLMGENRGYGASLKAGIRRAKGEWIAILDADGTYRPEELPLLLNMVETNDMVVGARTLAGAAIPFFRRSPNGFWANGPITWPSVKFPTLTPACVFSKKALWPAMKASFPTAFLSPRPSLWPWNATAISSNTCRFITNRGWDSQKSGLFGTRSTFLPWS